MDDEELTSQKDTDEFDIDEFFEDNRETKDNAKKQYVVKKRTFMVISFLFVGLIFFMCIFFYLLAPQLELIGGQEINVEYGENYKDPGYKATYFGKDITKAVYTTGKVDINKLGTYTLKYNVRKNRIVISKKRFVTVVDKTPPEIKLEGEEEVKICPNKEYEEKGFTATDKYDGDVTSKVEKIETEEEVKYKVTDSNGNTKTASRKLVRVDEEKPVITLKGNATVYVTINNKYTEPGFTATDNCDGDISKDVKVTGEVKTNTLGTYTLTYTVSDTKGNSDTKTRKVVVQNQSTAVKKVSSNMACGSPGVIYLTFDDGPNSTYTPKILDVLKKYGVKATFFVTSTGPDSLIKREANEGHAVGLHSSSHDYAKIYKSKEAFWNDMNIVAARVKRLTGKDSKLIRFPGGASNTVSRKYNKGIMTVLSRDVLDKGYNYFDWNISSGDAGGLRSATFEGKVSEEVRNVTGSLSKSRGNVILMHDIKQTTASAIERIVKYGKDNGYRFEVLTLDINCKQGINN